MTALSELLADAKGDLNIDQRIEEASKAGHAINRATVYKALKGEHAKSPTEPALKALAYVFELDVRDLREALNKPRGELGPWEPTTEAGQLNQEQRDALDELIKTIVRGGEAGDSTDGSRGAPTTKRPDSGPDESGLNNVTEMSPGRSTLRGQEERKRVASRPKSRKQPAPGD